MQGTDTVNERQRQVGQVLAGVFALIGFAFLFFISYVVFLQDGKMDISDTIMLPLSAIMVITDLTALVMIRRGRHVTGV